MGVALSPAFRERSPKALCLHCGQLRSEHIDGRCLFQPTVWKSLTQKQLDAWFERVKNERHMQPLDVNRTNVFYRVYQDAPRSDVSYDWVVSVRTLVDLANAELRVPLPTGDEVRRGIRIGMGLLPSFREFVDAVLNRSQEWKDWRWR